MINEIMDSLSFAVENHDIQVIVLDNLQFMTGSMTKFNKFDYQDEIIHKLRLFATERNVHIFLVIHPRKTDEALKVNSIFGTGKASQEADNIFIIQNYKGLRIVEIAKNRFNGLLGKTALGFNKGSCRFFEIEDSDFVAYNRGEITFDNILEKNDKSNKSDSNLLNDLEKYKSNNEVEVLPKKRNVNPDNFLTKQNEKINNLIKQSVEIKENINRSDKIDVKHNSIEIQFIENQDNKVLERNLNDNYIKGEELGDFKLFFNSSILPDNDKISSFHTEESKLNSNQFTESYKRIDNLKKNTREVKEDNDKFKKYQDIKDQIIVSGLI